MYISLQKVHPDCYEPNSRYLTDHPAVLGAYSSLPACTWFEYHDNEKYFGHSLESLEME
jgi:hypothetical protein